MITRWSRSLSNFYAAIGQNLTGEFMRKIMRHPSSETQGQIIGTLSKDDDDGSENVAKKMNLRSFKLNRVYLDPLNMSNVGDLSWS